MAGVFHGPLLGRGVFDTAKIAAGNKYQRPLGDPARELWGENRSSCLSSKAGMSARPGGCRALPYRRGAGVSLPHRRLPSSPVLG